jgi:hypothetical protein
VIRRSRYGAFVLFVAAAISAAACEGVVDVVARPANDAPDADGGSGDAGLDDASANADAPAKKTTDGGSCLKLVVGDGKTCQSSATLALSAGDTCSAKGLVFQTVLSEAKDCAGGSTTALAECCPAAGTDASAPCAQIKTPLTPGKCLTVEDQSAICPSDHVLDGVEGGKSCAAADGGTGATGGSVVCGCP